ncbi:M24 family metallopeptidase [Desulfoferrobacter suflitae]|uniref:M24 family metallopeptidase n=1 Tax=Desulfoferrobacter suflitae TaxID=2865782 RepID=UPI002164AEA4|nr:M24 family metallopeptidase [Desulfoferrobacter suflitae]MCK8601442.1 M24 family metallopeptidase [Desulfoferrobacter suflitae]
MALFATSEYLERIGKTKRQMADKSIDVLLVADPANMNYLTGYDGWSFYVPQVVVVAADLEQPIWIGRGMDANGAKHTTFLAPENIIGYPDNYVQSPIRHPYNFVADVLSERGLRNRTIGLEMDAYYFTAKCLGELKKSLPQGKFKDADLLVNWVRSVKSPQEIEYMKQAGKIMEKVMQTAIDTVAPGVRECDAVAAIYQAQMSGTSKFGGDYPAIVPMMPTGEKTSTPHLTWTDDPYRNETAVNLELAACRHRYHSPLARTMYLGKKPPQKLKDTAEVVVEGLHAALDKAKPGVVCEEVELVWRETIAKVGLEKESRIGYSLGLNYPPDWGEHTASLRPGDKTVLQPNMCFHMILGMWMDDWGFECSESFRVTENGSETFANFPRKLFIKE